MIKGIREALTVGAVNAVNSVSAENGFLKSPDIRIPLPGLLKNPRPFLRQQVSGPNLMNLKGQQSCCRVCSSGIKKDPA
jgi:hypothetical protein